MTTLARMPRNRIEQALLRQPFIHEHHDLNNSAYRESPLWVLNVDTPTMVKDVTQHVGLAAVYIAMGWAAKMLGMREYDPRDLQHLLTSSDYTEDAPRIMRILNSKNLLNDRPARQSILLAGMYAVEEIVEEVITNIYKYRQLHMRLTANRKLDSAKDFYRRVVALTEQRQDIEYEAKPGTKRQCKESRQAWVARKRAAVEKLIERSGYTIQNRIARLQEQAAVVDWGDDEDSEDDDTE